MKIGFSVYGLIVFILPLLPNLLFLLKRDSKENIENKSNAILDFIEHGSQGVFAILLVFLVSDKEVNLSSTYVKVALVFLIVYYIAWIIYFTIGANFLLLMLMAIIPVVYFIIAELWLYNVPAIIATLIFGILHVVITYENYHI